MLKLEKVAKTRELSVILRDKPALMSRSFLVALCYALFCHLFALLLFQISPFKISYEASIISPVLVASEFFSDPHQQISVHYDENSIVPDYLIVPRMMPSKLPAVLRQSDLVSKDIIKPEIASKSAFVALEDRIEIQPMINILSPKTKNSPFHAKASGIIAERDVIINQEQSRGKIERFALLNPSTKLNSSYNLTFSVMVEQSQGEIIWWEAQNENNDPKIYWLMISLLENLGFEKGSHQTIEKGKIELTINFLDYD